MPRFVILRHEMPAASDRETHFDLMLEADGVLRTWSLPELPAAGKEIPAEALSDHRLAYLDCEGPVSGNRGSVGRVHEGEFEIVTETPALLEVRLAGKSLQGTLTLRREQDAPVPWVATFRPLVEKFLQ